MNSTQSHLRDPTKYADTEKKMTEDPYIGMINQQQVNVIDKNNCINGGSSIMSLVEKEKPYVRKLDVFKIPQTSKDGDVKNTIQIQNDNYKGMEQSNYGLDYT